MIDRINLALRNQRCLSGSAITLDNGNVSFYFKFIPNMLSFNYDFVLAFHVQLLNILNRSINIILWRTEKFILIINIRLKAIYFFKMHQII